MPEEQADSVPQSVLHAPHVLLVESDASQPSWTLPLQSANPVMQVHAPPEQVSFTPQVFPQPPQLEGSEPVSVSQELVVSPSQSTVFAGHVQNPCTHCWSKAHATPQWPQLAGSVTASTSQPSATFWLQSMNPNAQMLVQVAFEHRVPGHPAPQTRQLWGSFARSTQTPSQQVFVAAHGAQTASASVMLPSAPPSTEPSVSTTPPCPLSLCAGTF
jgi:hypothetical protein